MNDGSNACRYVVSACLAGECCKYDGSSNFNEKIARLARAGLVVCVCPEVLGGLPTPRTPSEIQGRRVVSRTGDDMTAFFQSGAEKALEIAKRNGCTAAILKARSPSCGCGSVYDGSFSRTLVQGDGVFASLLKKQGFKVFTEENTPSLPDIP